MTAAVQTIRKRVTYQVASLKSPTGDRIGSVQTFRKWVTDQEAWLKSPTGK